jgi:hypothetical protein
MLPIPAAERQNDQAIRIIRAVNGDGAKMAGTRFYSHPHRLTLRLPVFC